MDTSPSLAQSVPILSSIAELAPARDVWLTDIWGVMHNGVHAFAAACDACTQFRRSGGTVLLLSNAPRPSEQIVIQLDRLGVPRTAWDAVLTSGDAARALVGAYTGQRVFHLGPDRDLPLYEGLGVTLSEAADADAVSCTGLFNDEIETPDDYAAVLAALAERKVPMICANPDLTVERGSEIVYCAGALAAEFIALGGSVSYAGKPYLPVYDMAFSMIETLRGTPVPRERILCIGDGIRTDIKGAAAAGLDSVFIASGIHVTEPLTSEHLSELFSAVERLPLAAMPALAW